MKQLISILLASQLVCGFGFFRPRHNNSGQYVQMAGLAESGWLSSSANTGTFTYTDDSNKSKVRVDGLAEYARVWVVTTSGEWSLKQFRTTATNNFDFVTSTEWTPSAAGTNIVPLAWTLVEGDAIGTFLPNGTSAFRLTGGGPAAGMDLRYTNVNITSGSFQMPGLANGNAQNIGIWGKGPAIGFNGDSIQTGYPNYSPYLASEAIGGMASNSVPWKLKHIYARRGHYTDFCVGNTTVQTAAGTQMDALTNHGTKVVVIQSGVNNIPTADAWADVEDDYLLMRTKHKGPLYFCSILPSNTLSDSEAFKLRTWNTNLMALAAANGAFFINLTTAFGTNRTSTSQLDDVKPELFQADTLHLNTAGSDLYAQLLSIPLSLHAQ